MARLATVRGVALRVAGLHLGNDLAERHRSGGSSLRPGAGRGMVGAVLLPEQPDRAHRAEPAILHAYCQRRGAELSVGDRGPDSCQVAGFGTGLERNCSPVFAATVAVVRPRLRLLPAGSSLSLRVVCPRG